MLISPPPTNFQWIGNILSYILDPNVTGLQIKYKKDGVTDWIVVFDNENSAPSSCPLPSTLGPTGEVMGLTRKATDHTWGPPVIEEITNQIL
jgi:hypothetical protein